MGQILLTIPDDKISSFLSFIKNLDFVEKIEKASEFNKPLEEDDWIKPGRPATDEEFEQMIFEMEKEEKEGLGMVAEDAKKYVTKRIDEWEKK